MDYARISNILLKIGTKTPVLLGPMKYVIQNQIQNALNSADIHATLDWVNISEYQMIKQFDDLMRSNPGKLDVFEKIFTI